MLAARVSRGSLNCCCPKDIGWLGYGSLGLSDDHLSRADGTGGGSRQGHRGRYLGCAQQHHVGLVLRCRRYQELGRGVVGSVYKVYAGLLAEEGVIGVQQAVMLAGIVAFAVTVFIALRFRQLWRLN